MNNKLSVVKDIPTDDLQIKDYTVTQISGYIKQSMESNFGYVRVRGEISGLKIAASGHGYFNLKDTNAVLSATCWRHVLGKLRDTLCEGLEVIATGKITTYSGQSKYQLSVEYIEHAGIGALMQILSARKAALQKEGLFDASRKKPIPYFPKIIGVVTSITGSVIQDMIHRISDRCPTRIIIWPVTVQGEKAANEIVEAISGINSLEYPNKPDVIIVARGGGSIEDLWAFNEEAVVRAVAESEIPIISAIGHETDFTLTDFAADVRAPTPTAAAEFATPVLLDLKQTICSIYSNISNVLHKSIRQQEELLQLYNKILSNPMSLVLIREQHIDHISMNAFTTIKNIIAFKGMRLDRYELNSNFQSNMILFKERHLESITKALDKSIFSYMERANTSLHLIRVLLSSLDYKKVLQRGFAIIRDNKNDLITSVTQVEKNQNLSVEMQDGKVEVYIK